MVRQIAITLMMLTTGCLGAGSLGPVSIDSIFADPSALAPVITITLPTDNVNLIEFFIVDDNADQTQLQCSRSDVLQELTNFQLGTTITVRLNTNRQGFYWVLACFSNNIDGSRLNTGSQLVSVAYIDPVFMAQGVSVSASLSVTGSIPSDGAITYTETLSGTLRLNQNANLSLWSEARVVFCPAQAPRMQLVPLSDSCGNLSSVHFGLNSFGPVTLLSFSLPEDAALDEIRRHVVRYGVTLYAVFSGGNQTVTRLIAHLPQIPFIAGFELVEGSSER
jgi:hypothetical protein